MIRYQDYPEISSIATVRVINFQDEHSGVGITLQAVANRDYNSFRLVKFNDSYSKENHIAAMDDYISITNTCRVQHGDDLPLLSPHHILVLQKHVSGHQYAIPYEYYKGNKHSMFSGLYISGDSTMSDMLGHSYPIGVHNRLE